MTTITTTSNIVLTDATAAAGTLLWNGSYLQLSERGKSIPVTVHLTAESLQLCRTTLNNGNTGGSNISKSVERFVFDQIASCSVVSTEEVLQQEEERRRRSRSRCLGGEKKSLLQQRLLETDVCLQMVIYPAAAVDSLTSTSSSSKLTAKRPPPNQRRIVTLIINSHSSQEENRSEAELFQRKVASLIHSGHSLSAPLLIILNPKSGKGKTIKIFDRKVKPLLDDCAIKYHVLVTKHANHASEFIESQGQDLATSYSAVVTVSGDGLLFEVLNGFVGHLEDGSCKHIPIPISIIPGGSGNGLAHSINSLFLDNGGDGGPRKSTNQVLDCTFHVIKGQPVAMDLVRITTRSKTYLSFLSFGWGLMADVDIESERLRCIGEPRFAIWSIYRSLALRSYGGKLSYLPVRGGDTEEGVEVPKLDFPIEDKNWVVESGDFVLVYAAYQRYLNSSVMFAPTSTLDDQTIYLLFIKSGVSSCQVIQFLLALEDGSHVTLPFVSFVPVKAFRLEPTSEQNIMTIDGEQIQCSPVQAEVSLKTARILLRSPSQVIKD